MQKPAVILISGGTCSGKSEFAKWFKSSLLISLDRFYLPISLLPKDKKGNFDFDTPKAVAIKECAFFVKTLIGKGRAKIPKYDFLKNDRVGEEIVALKKNTKFIVVEGMFAFHSPLLELGNLKIFLDTPPEIRVARRMIRDMKRKNRTRSETLTDFIHTEERFKKFVEPTRKKADIVIPFSLNPMQTS